MDGLEIGQFVVVGVDAHAEEQPRVPPVHDLVVAELDEVGLVFLVPGRDEPVDLCFVLGKKMGQPGFFPGKEGERRRDGLRLSV